MTEYAKAECAVCHRRLPKNEMIPSWKVEPRLGALRIYSRRGASEGVFWKVTNFWLCKEDAAANPDLANPGPRLYFRAFFTAGKWMLFAILVRMVFALFVIVLMVVFALFFMQVR